MVLIVIAKLRETLRYKATFFISTNFSHRYAFEQPTFWTVTKFILTWCSSANFVHYKNNFYYDSEITSYSYFTGDNPTSITFFYRKAGTQIKSFLDKKAGTKLAKNADNMALLKNYFELVKRLTNFEVFPEHEMFFQGAQVKI